MNNKHSVFSLIRNPNKTMRLAGFLLLIAFLNLEFGCNYYRVRTIDRMNEEISKTKLLEYQAKNKYIILNCKGQRYHLSMLEINKENMTLTASASQVDYNHILYYPDAHSKARYQNKRNERPVINEVHLLAENFKKIEDEKVSINLKDIKRIDIIEKDTGRSIASHVIITAGIIGAAFVLLSIIILLLKTSCPFIYVKDGGTYVFKGELFGGAIFKPLERDDYIALKTLNETDSILQIKISNELKERQYTDIAEAIIAEHGKEQSALIDSKGIVHLINEPSPPISAMLNKSFDMTTTLQKMDSASCLFDGRANQHFSNELQLTFPKPVNVKKAKLMLHAKNSLWLDYAFGEFTKLFGIYYNSWVKKQSITHADTLNAWIIKQNLPLSVYVKNNGKWQLAERVPTIGPLAFRDLCIPVDVSPTTSSKLEIKLTCGFMFWEVDYAGIDYSDDSGIKAFTLNPASATDEHGNNCKEELSYSDKSYLYQPGPGYEATINYQLPKMEKNKRYDVFLHTRGYYEHKRDYDGLPDRKLLESFKQEGAFVEFSENLYNRIEMNTGLAGIINR